MHLVLKDILYQVQYTTIIYTTNTTTISIDSDTLQLTRDVSNYLSVDQSACACVAFMSIYNKQLKH
jgi:hypothetical protein